MKSLEKQISGRLAEARKESAGINARLKRSPDGITLLLRGRSIADTVIRLEKELREARRCVGSGTRGRGVGASLPAVSARRGGRGSRSASKSSPDAAFRYDNDDISFDDAVECNNGVLFACNKGILRVKNGE